MTRTLTALFDSHAEAEQARQRLAQLGIPPGTIDVMDQSAAPAVQATAGTDSLWEKFKHLLLPDTDRIEYEEGIRRGGSLLTAPIDDRLADRAIAALEECHPVDINQRTAEWRKAGWGAQTRARSPSSSSTMRSGGSQEEVIPVAEEQLHVGKREVDRGGVRVHSRVIEEPVEENVRLRDENVEGERRPASGAAATGAKGDLLKERTVEMREKAEEPVIQKDTRVKEEVVVRKRAEEREQPVKDTVKRTQVDIEKNREGAPPPGTRVGDTRTPRH